MVLRRVIQQDGTLKFSLGCSSAQSDLTRATRSYLPYNLQKQGYLRTGRLNDLRIYIKTGVSRGSGPHLQRSLLRDPPRWVNTDRGGFCPEFVGIHAAFTTHPHHYATLLLC